MRGSLEVCDTACVSDGGFGRKGGHDFFFIKDNTYALGHILIGGVVTCERGCDWSLFLADEAAQPLLDALGWSIAFINWHRFGGSAKIVIGQLEHVNRVETVR